jgi:hypothetical protein
MLLLEYRVLVRDNQPIILLPAQHGSIPFSKSEPFVNPCLYLSAIAAWHVFTQHACTWTSWDISILRCAMLMSVKLVCLVVAYAFEVNHGKQTFDN